MNPKTGYERERQAVLGTAVTFGTRHFRSAEHNF